MAAVKQVHGVNRHAHVGDALALDHVELLDRDDRVASGETSPTF
jgi:hypothetical protein